MKSNLEKYFVLFSCCYITKGFNRSIIIDTQRNNFHFVPHVLTELIEEVAIETLGQIMQQFTEEEEKKIFNEYLFFLEENELGFYTDNPISFPKIDNTFRLSKIISNAILDFRIDIMYPLDIRLMELETLGCEAVQIRIFENLATATFLKLIKSFETLSFHYIELLLNADEIYNARYLKKILKTNPNINKIVLYNSTDNNVVVINNYQIMESRITPLESVEQCGQIGVKYFTTDLKQVIESHTYNSCLNKKISIDEKGFIKNCPSLNQTFGNAQESSLIEAIEKNGFKNLWSLTKDKVDVCKDCEFRYICTDCRAYTKITDDIYSKPLKCGYDPYSNIWQDWSLNQLSTAAKNI